MQFHDLTFNLGIEVSLLLTQCPEKGQQPGLPVRFVRSQRNLCTAQDQVVAILALLENTLYGVDTEFGEYRRLSPIEPLRESGRHRDPCFIREIPLSAEAFISFAFVSASNRKSSLSCIFFTGADMLSSISLLLVHSCINHLNSIKR